MKIFKESSIALLSLALVSTPVFAWKMEADSVTLTAVAVTSDFQSVSFDQTYDAVPLVFVLGTADSAPAAVRIKDVTTTGFKALVVEPDGEDGTHDSMTIHYLAIEPGEHSMPDGTKISAALTTLGSAAHKSYHSDLNTGYATFEYFSEGFSQAPTLIAQIQDMTGETGTPPATTSQPWMTNVFNNPTTTSVSIALEHGEVDATLPTADIPVGILAIDSNTSGNFSDTTGSTVYWETKNTTLSAATIASLSPFSRTCSYVTLDTDFSSAPLVLGAKASRNTTDGGWLARCSSGSGNGLTQINLAIEEDSDKDAERTPSSETVNLFAFSDSFYVDFGVGGNSFNGLRLSHSGIGTHCDWLPIDIRAVTQSGTTIKDYQQTIEVGLDGPGEWQLLEGNGTFSYMPGSGVARYQFASSDEGSARLSVRYMGGQENVFLKAYQVDDRTVDDDGINTKVQYAAQNLVITENVFTPEGEHIFSAAQKAGEPFEVHLAIFGETEGQLCDVFGAYDQRARIEIAPEYLNPTVHTKRLKYDNGEDFWPIPSRGIDVDFQGGKAVLRFKYDDVGQIKIRFKMQLTTADGIKNIEGATAPFVIKPYDVLVEEVSTRVNSETIRPAFWGMPAEAVELSTAPETAFVSAGEPFKVVLKPINKDGEFTPNFGREEPEQRLTVESVLVSPNIGKNGSRDDGVMINAHFERGYDTFTAREVAFDEVGYIKLQPHVEGKDYLGAGDIEAMPSATIGRFVADRFQLEMKQAPQLTTFCSAQNMEEGFSYLRQPLTFSSPAMLDVIPISASGAPLHNYQDFSAWGELNYYKLPLMLSAEGSESNQPAFLIYKEQLETGKLPKAHVSIDEALRFAALTESDGVQSDGRRTYTLQQAQTTEQPWIRFESDNNEIIPPFEAEVGMLVTIEDADGVGLVSRALHDWAPDNDIVLASELVSEDDLAPGTGIPFDSGNEIRLGRMVVQSVVGESKRPIEVPIAVEYFDGLEYRLNQQDHCTNIDDIDVSGIQFYNIKITPDTPQILQDTKVSLGAQFDKGKNFLTVTLPEADVRGSMDVLVPIVAVPWLQFDWPNDGQYDNVMDDSPSASITFGSGGDNSDYDFWEDLY